MGGGSVRRCDISAIGGQSPLLRFDTAALSEFPDTLKGNSFAPLSPYSEKGV